MLNTKKIKDHKNTLIIAHRGASGIEPENTISAFIAAANRSYFGIETDVHKTKDGKFILTHDDNAKRVTGVDTVIEETDFETLRSIKIFEKDGKSYRSDLYMPSLEEYIKICKAYGKIAVLELKNSFPKEDIFSICDEINELGYLEGTIFISFVIENLHYVKEKHPEQTVQFLIHRNTQDELPKDLIDMLASYKFDLDIYYKLATPDFIKACHEKNVKVNVWTVDELSNAEKLIESGVDFITSNIIE